MDHDPTWRAYESGGFRPEIVGGTEAKTRPPLKLHPARLPDPATIAPRQWLYGTQLIRGYVTVLVAPGGTGKSSYAMAVALGLSCDTPILGEHIFLPVKVSVFNLEDKLEELERRLAALMIRYKIPPAKVQGNYFLDDGEERGLTMAALGDDGFTVVSPDEEAMISEVLANDIGLVICDPFAESHSLEENSNPQMVKAAAAWRRVARATNCAVLLVHHVRKGDATGIDAARGAKALTDSARVGLLMTTMSEKEGETFNVGPDDRWQYVRLDDAKRNMAPAAKARWFKLDQVSLGNDQDPLYPRGDKVAAIIPWEPPTVWAQTSSLQLNQALDVLSSPPAGWLYASTRRGRDNKRWAGGPIMDATECTDRQAALIITEWLKSGLLYEETYRDQEQRKDRTGVRVDESKRPS